MKIVFFKVSLQMETSKGESVARPWILCTLSVVIEFIIFFAIFLVRTQPVRGFINWPNFHTRLFREHENSKNHLEADLYN